jgi:hypothetical protein
MQSRQVYEEEHVVTVDLRTEISPNYLVRRMAKAVYLSFIYELTYDLYCEDNRLSVDPVLFFGMQLIGYLFGISSEAVREARWSESWRAHR